MTTKNDGGPAFPTYGVSSGTHAYEQLLEIRDGMTLRDYFAAAALPIAERAERDAPTYGAANGDASYRGIAERAYRLADSMLAERAK